jgi:DUF2075 family protein
MKNFSISHYAFNNELEKNILDNHRDYLTWPLVYFLNDNTSKDAYVGETTDVLNRMKTHSKTERKSKLSTVNLIVSDFFNKSATLDLESNLIRYIAADGQYKLQNGNLGIANHKYYQQKELYWELFKNIWDELRSMGIARHSLDHINNSDLFKYSPYKSLSKEQVKSLKLILNCLLDDSAKVSLIQGGAGTGKSILAIFLFKLLKTDIETFNFSDFEEEAEELFELLNLVKQKYGDLQMALVIPMASFRKTISKVFKNIQGLSPKMVIGPSDLAKQKFDLVIVDEGHRLRRRVNLGPYFKPFDDICNLFGLDKLNASELDWLLIQSKKTLLFYDQFQSIKPSDTLREKFIELENQPFTRKETLKTQFRCRGGNEYVSFIGELFSDDTTPNPIQNIDYECFIFDDIQQMVDEIHKKESIDGLSRLVAGYAWEWLSNKDEKAFDITIDETKLKWNSVAVDWVNTPNSINEVGCIHTTQGYDLNYTGVIIGPEIDYDFNTNSFVIYKERYKDKAGKNTVTDELILKNYILNIYRTISLRGIKGTFFYVCNPNLRAYFHKFMPKNQPLEIINTPKILNDPNEFTIPFYDLKISAGNFSEHQQSTQIQYLELEEGESFINENYFACRVVGESMNKIIPNNSICLFEKYNGGSRNGLITLVEMLDFTDIETGGNYTIKEYSSKKTISEDSWSHLEIKLLPKSTLNFEPITLTDDETISLKVIGTFIKVLY